jgi:hypothetical protein
LETERADKTEGEINGGGRKIGRKLRNKQKVK